MEEQKVIYLDFRMPLNVPDDFQISEEEKRKMLLRAIDFVQWELNILVKKKTGYIHYFGVSQTESEASNETQN